MKAQIDALAKYRNQLLSAFNAQQLAEMKRSNWSGLLEQTDTLYATMYHDWDVLQKDSNDLAEAVQTLEWTVAPYVADGEEATPEAQAVAKVVTDALWKRTPQGLGTYSHTFTQLIGSLVHGLFRGFNVHEIEWKNDGNMVYPACFHQLPAQYMRWEDRAGHPDKLLFIADGETAEAKPFPAYKYIVGLNTSGPDHPIYNATYYSLVAWFGAFKFGLGWFMEYCQKYGIPKLVFHYESPNDRKQLEKDLSEERVLNNILLKGDRTVDIANAPASGASLPQRELLNLAESACHKLILGQTLTSDTSEHGGSLAQAKVHAGVQADIVKKRADYVADVLNTQLIPAIVLLNYGKLDVPMPELRFKIPQEGVTLERVQVVKTALEIKGMKLKKSEVYEFTGFAQPAEGDDVFEAASEGTDMAGLAGLMGKGKPQDDTDPDDDPNKPKKKAAAKESEDVEPVSAAKTDAPTDPAQEWLAPIKQKFLEARKAGASMADMRKMLLTMHPNTKALAKAFANNILAGFAGESEEVDAANPYGCNQYGEGWREPHNGRASKPGAPVKKTDSTEEERKQKEEKEGKDLEDELKDAEKTAEEIESKFLDAEPGPNEQRQRSAAVALSSGNAGLEKVWNTALSKEEQQVIYNYTLDSRDINKSLRDAQRPEDLSEEAKNLNSALNKGRIPNNVLLQRGETGEELVSAGLATSEELSTIEGRKNVVIRLRERLKNGEEIVLQNKGAISTSFNFSETEFYAKSKVRRCINVRAGTPGLCVAPVSHFGGRKQAGEKINLDSFRRSGKTGEAEVLIAPGIKTKVTRVGIDVTGEIFIEEEVL